VSERELLHQTADYAADFLSTLDERPVRPDASVDELFAALGGPLPEEGLDPHAVIASLVEDAEPGIIGIPSGRFFGFVIGGAVPAAVAADWLTSVWDHAMRISVSNWRTTEQDVDRSVDSILAAAGVPA
jgi:hypothetical protein